MAKRLGSRASEMQMKLRAGETFTQSVSGVIDAAIHCTESGIFVFGVGQATETSRLGYLWELTLKTANQQRGVSTSIPLPTVPILLACASTEIISIPSIGIRQTPMT